MGFFLETLLGGLMTGMLYALVALGFVLIFKASGVFNFAQGAMVLFAALAMARFSEWIPRWLGMEQGVISVLLSIVVSIVIMIGVAYAVERLALRHLVNQEPITLLMATLGIAYLLDGLGPMIFGSAVYSINVGMPKEPVFILEGLFDGGVLVSKEDLYSAIIAAVLRHFEHQRAVLDLGVQRVQDVGQILRELHVHDGAQHLRDLADVVLHRAISLLRRLRHRR